MTDEKNGKFSKNKIVTVFITSEPLPRKISDTKKMDDRARESPTNSWESKSESPEPFRKSYLKEILAATIICLGPVCMGLVTGYSSPVISDISRHNRSIHLDGQEQSLFSSLMTIGALFGGLIAGILVDTMGRKLCLMFVCCPFVLGWLLIAYSNHVMNAYISMIYAGRVVTGMCVGITSMCAPTYVSEIASPEIRGILGSGFQLCMNLGILFVFSLGAVVPWTYLALISCASPLILIVLVIPLPESPTWLIKKKRKHEAVEALFWLRKNKTVAQDEADDIELSTENDSRISFTDFLRPELWKPFVIMFMEMFFQQFSGINVVVFNAATIFSSANKDMDPNVAAIIVALVMVIAIVGTLFFVDRAGRRILLIISGASMGVSMAVLGGYYYAQFLDKTLVQNITWLPIVCLIIFVSTFNLGFGPIPWLMMSEVFPTQAKGLASSIIAALNWTLAFVVTKTYFDLKTIIHQHGVFWIYAAVCMLSVIYVWKCVPETKGKTFQEIQQIFIGRRELEIEEQLEEQT